MPADREAASDPGADAPAFGSGMSNHDIIVVGVGAMGASACWQLARRGVRVLGLEQFDIPHGRGSSHGYSRIIRQAYFEHPDYVPLLRRSYELWRELESVTGTELLHLVGGLYMGPGNGEVVAGSFSAALKHGIEHSMLDRSELAKQFPQFHLPDDWVGLLEPGAGFVRPEASIAAFAIAAMQQGAELHGHEKVLDWSSDGGGVTVRTDRGEYHAKELVFCGGAWSGQLLRDLDVPLNVTRQVLGWVWPKEPDLFGPEKLPVWAIDNLDGSIYYGFPMQPDNPGFKLALHKPMETVSPDHVNRDTGPTDEQTFRPCLERFIPDANGPLLAMRVCLYTNSPDGHFILDRHPRHDHVTIACGFSGHGFKFASVVGEVLADLAMTGKTDLPAQFLSLKRFSSGSLSPEKGRGLG